MYHLIILFMVIYSPVFWFAYISSGRMGYVMFIVQLTYVHVSSDGVGYGDIHVSSCRMGYGDIHVSSCRMGYGDIHVSSGRMGYGDIQL